MILKDIAKMTFEFKSAKKMLANSLADTTSQVEAVNMFRKISRCFVDDKQVRELFCIYRDWTRKHGT